MAKTHEKQRAKAKERASSPFIQITRSLFLSASPCATNYPVEGLCAEHISPLILSYYPPFGGVLLSYSNPRISEAPDDDTAPENIVFARSIDEYGVTYVWFTAEFLVFAPTAGAKLEGQIVLQNESYLGLICYNYFSAGIDAEKLPEDWSWDDNAGEWRDGAGEQIKGSITFMVEDFTASGTDSIQIAGTLRAATR